MDIICCGSLIVLFFTFLICGVKNELTCRYSLLFVDAIGRYKLEKIDKGEYTFDVDFEDLEEYNKTLLRLWGWGYTRILPPEKFEIIKPYIPLKGKENKNARP